MFWKKKSSNSKMKIDPDSVAVIRQISSVGFSLVTEIEEDGTERILGKSGCVNFTADDYVTVISNGSETFRCTINSLRASLLMSGNGARIEGLDDDGNKHKIIAVFNRRG